MPPDRVHPAMLVHTGGQTSGFRARLTAGRERGPDLVRLPTALSAPYPKGSETTRLFDAMLLAVPG